MPFTDDLPLRIPRNEFSTSYVDEEERSDFFEKGDARSMSMSFVVLPRPLALVLLMGNAIEFYSKPKHAEMAAETATHGRHPSSGPFSAGIRSSGMVPFSSSYSSLASPFPPSSRSGPSLRSSYTTKKTTKVREKERELARSPRSLARGIFLIKHPSPRRRPRRRRCHLIVCSSSCGLPARVDPA